LFVTFYPFALVSAIFLGWRTGLVVAIASALAANYLLIAPAFQLSLDRSSIGVTSAFLLVYCLIIGTTSILRDALRRLHAANKLELRLNAELQHRMKNTLAVIQGIVRQTSYRYSDPKQFERALSGRIMALSCAHEILSEGNWEGCELLILADRALASFQDMRRITINGPTCQLAVDSCVPLVLALHELATNASKYGALSVQDGRVELRWCTAGETVSLQWVEHDGPVVTEPTRQGLGSRLLTKQGGLDAVTLQFKPQGVECEITIRRAKPERAQVSRFSLAP